MKTKSYLPIAGIVAFSLASVWSLFQLFAGSAEHPGPILWGPSVLVELVTAWLVYSCVGMTRKALLSNISIQDRKFYQVMLGLNLALTVPTLGASIYANTLEFHSVLLGLLFPVASIACAVALGITDAMESHKKTKQAEAQEEKRKREANQRQKAAKQQARLGNAAETLRAFQENPQATQAELAAAIGISERTVRYHLAKLQTEGLVKRNGSGIEVVSR